METFNIPEPKFLAKCPIRCTVKNEIDRMSIYDGYIFKFGDPFLHCGKNEEIIFDVSFGHNGSYDEYALIKREGLYNENYNQELKDYDKTQKEFIAAHTEWAHKRDEYVKQQVNESEFLEYKRLQAKFLGK